MGMQSGLIDVMNCGYEPNSPLRDFCWVDPHSPFNFYSGETVELRKGLELVDGLYSGDIGKVIGNFILNPLAQRPGQGYHYVNMNFILASYILEKLVGVGLGEYLRTNVYAPLNLT